METAPLVVLNSGYAMPVLALGTWPLRGREAEHAVTAAIDAGYRHIDTASRYENETAVGDGIHAASASRDEIFLTTKLRGADIRDGAVRSGLEASLAALRTDYVDLYLIHWPLPRLGRAAWAFQEMAAMVAAGLIRSIGVSNFRSHHIDGLIAETGLVPAVDQVECDPTIARRSLRGRLASSGIAPQAWSPLGRGGPLLSDPVIVRAAEASGCTPGQVILRWHRAHDIAPVAKSSDPDRQRENLAAMSMPPLSPEVVAALDALDPDDEGEQRIRDSDVHEEY